MTVTVGEDFERLVRAFGRFAEGDGLPERLGPPTPEQMQALASVCLRYGIEFVGPPLALVRDLAGAAVHTREHMRVLGNARRSQITVESSRHYCCRWGCDLRAEA